MVKICLYDSIQQRTCRRNENQVWIAIEAEYKISICWESQYTLQGCDPEGQHGNRPYFPSEAKQYSPTRWTLQTLASGR